MNQSKKKECEFVRQPDFKKQTPEMQIKEKKPGALYEKAFLSREDQNRTEHARNTATWD